MATPPSRRQGLQLALVAVVMTGALPLSSLLLSPIQNVPGWVMTGVVVTGALGLVPLLLAIVALVGRAVRPAWLLGVALALLLIQPIARILEAMRLLDMLHTTALLLAIATGCAAGVIAAGLIPVDRDRRMPLVLLIPLIVLFAAGVSIAATIVFEFRVFTPLVAVVVAILLGVEIMRHRQQDAHDDVVVPESVAP